MDFNGDFSQIPRGEYQIVYADPPWYVTDYSTASARKHYEVMTEAELHSLNVKSLMTDKAALFLWATCSRLDMAIRTIAAWGLHYRGVAYIWVKTNGAGRIINAKGVPPTFTKPNAEFVLSATTMPRGRPMRLLSSKEPQIILAPLRRHSEKPGIVRESIVNLFGDSCRKIELFARSMEYDGWDRWGNQLGK